MTPYSGEELAASFRTVRHNTIQIAEDIPAESYAFRASPDTRTVAETLVHIAYLHIFQQRVHSEGMTDLRHVDFTAFAQQAMPEAQDALRARIAEAPLPGSAAIELAWHTLEEQPRTRAEILSLLTAEGEKFAAYLDGLTASYVAERVTMPGPQPETKSRFEMLASVKEHEMHHRGQLMLLQRMAGIVPHLTRRKLATTA
jgi:uncharacterized damage-inducible protein DinB